MDTINPDASNIAIIHICEIVQISAQDNTKRYALIDHKNEFLIQRLLITASKLGYKINRNFL